ILSSVNSGSNLSYQWKKDGINIIGATQKMLTVTVTGKYKVKVTDNTNNCSATSANVKVKVPCRINSDEGNNARDLQLKVYPNPVSQLAVVSWQLARDEYVSLKIFDLQGKLVRTLANSELSEGIHTFTWDLCDDNGQRVT